MNESGYDTFDDPYCYKRTFVLKNKAGLRDAERLEAFEVEMTSLRALEPRPEGKFEPAHYRAFHRHMFGDVYAWAGRYRTVRTSKGGNVFCYPEHIASQMDKLFAVLQRAPFTGGATSSEFVGAAASFLAELNAIHAFREGNGRVQLSFMHAISIRAGYELDFTQIRHRAFLNAMIRSFEGDLASLKRALRQML
jgi:cell filamentation protein